MTALTPVRVRDCTCPDTPHDGHNVFVAPTISLEGGLAAEKVMIEIALRHPGEDQEAERLRALVDAWAPIFVRYGAKDWDLCDEQGQPVPFDVEAVLDDYSMARLVADKTGDLGYGSAVMAPFLAQRTTPSRNGRTKATTSRAHARTRSSRG